MQGLRVAALVAIAALLFSCGATAESATYNGTDGHVYVLQTGLHSDLRTWKDAKSWCNGVQFNGKPSLLCPYRNQPLGDSVNAIRDLCGSRQKTCWLEGETKQGGPGEMLCPLVTSYDWIIYQGCQQVVSFVCRSADPKSFKGLDGRTYTLFFLGAVRTWAEAAEYCHTIGTELSPYNTDSLYAGDAAYAVKLLCARSTSTTCWLGERPGCQQVVSFVCRSADPVNTPSAADPAPAPSSGPDPAPGDGAPVPAPVPVPAYGSGGGSDVPTDVGSVPLGAFQQKSFKGLDGRTYTLFFLGAVRTWAEAAEYCHTIGTELSPYNTDSLYAGDAAYAVKLLCARSTSTTCWLGERPVGHEGSGDMMCPMLDQAGDQHYQDCGQPMAFVCRTKQAESQPSNDTANDPTPWRLAPTPADSRLGADGRHYTLYSGPQRSRRTHRAAMDHCSSIGQELAPYDPDASPYSPSADSVASVRALCGGKAGLTCWVHAKSVDGLCPVYSGHDNKVYWQGCIQLVSWVCRTSQPVASADLNGDDAADDGPITPLPTPAAEVTYPPTAVPDGYTYKLFRGDAPNRRNYTEAVRFCESQGGELSPFNRRAPEGNSVRAVRYLCGGAATTCWVRQRLIGDEYCPLVSQEVVVQWQTCEQQLNFVCRFKVGQEGGKRR
ncbi:zsp2a [Gonium pectorale]|uniref:Zsp2a n=1 Tax=Gonium pectorale TaxID=33097 RepID=A0A150GI75_GONPE|nr:zsp2a [Gonium pectorale]|eukprot:KXZ49526.1 zsp2a [Gonium pectorale]